jgi:two-component system cell cycle sensor histidine kinase/response regulator CckA
MSDRDAKGQPADAVRALHVLVVDDEEPIRKFVERVLTEAGHRPTLAADGEEALAISRQHGPFDLLLTDVHMPKVMGDELARRLRQDDPTLKVLYLTGFSDLLFKEKMTLWEDEAYLDKPCSMKGLIEAISLLVFGRVQ